VRTRLFLIFLVLLASVSALPGQQPPDSARGRRAAPTANATDLDVLMAQVLNNRDQNWRKLQQYILDETQTMTMTGPADLRLFGGRREYTWFPRDGFFIRSPTKVDGVEIGDADRRKAEDRHLGREKAREKRREVLRKENPDDPDLAEPGGGPADGVGDIIRQTAEPDFVEMAYFLRFKFDEGHYALVGREQLLGRSVLKIEYYPSKLFNDDPDGPMTREEQEKRAKAIAERRAKETEKDRERRRKDDELDARIQRQMNKGAKATLWVDPALNQILQYEVHNMEMDFLPGRSMVRIDELTASMRMAQPFPDVWLPQMMDIRAGFMSALGRVSAHYDVKYTDYRLASTSARIR
jgi:hypothetical protein